MVICEIYVCTFKLPRIGFTEEKCAVGACVYPCTDSYGFHWNNSNTFQQKKKGNWASSCISALETTTCPVRGLWPPYRVSKYNFSSEILVERYSRNQVLFPLDMLSVMLCVMRSILLRRHKGLFFKLTFPCPWTGLMAKYFGSQIKRLKMNSAITSTKKIPLL